MSADTAKTEYPAGLPESEHRRYGRKLLAVVAAGMLFLGGQGLRWWQEKSRLAAMEGALDQVYRQALGGEPGKSPYGRLQFELGKLRAEGSQRLDLLELLAALSRRAPEGVRIDSVAMSGNSGVAAGAAKTRADFQRFQSALAAEAFFSFSVLRADQAAEPVAFELGVKALDRTAPPKEDR